MNEDQNSILQLSSESTDKNLYLKLLDALFSFLFQVRALFLSLELALSTMLKSQHRASLSELFPVLRYNFFSLVARN